MHLRKLATAAAVAGLLMSGVFTPSSAMAATTMNLEPETQTRNHNVASNWSGNWGSRAPYTVNMNYGDGTGTGTFTISITGLSFTHTYSPCTDRTYKANLTARETGGYNHSDEAFATERGGSPC